jgi:hypothetical protein
MISEFIGGFSGLCRGSRHVRVQKCFEGDGDCALYDTETEDFRWIWKLGLRLNKPASPTARMYLQPIA